MKAKAVPTAEYREEINKALALYHSGKAPDAESLLLELRNRLQEGLLNYCGSTEFQEVLQLLILTRKSSRDQVDPLWDELQQFMQRQFTTTAQVYASVAANHSKMLFEAGRIDEGRVVLERALAISALVPDYPLDAYWRALGAYRKAVQGLKPAKEPSGD